MQCFRMVRRLSSYSKVSSSSPRHPSTAIAEMSLVPPSASRPATPRSLPPSYSFVFQPTPPLFYPPTAHQQSLLIPPQAPSHARAMQDDKQPQPHVPSRQRSLGFSNLFSKGNNGSTSRKKAAPPPPLTLAKSLLLPHPRPSTPSSTQQYLGLAPDSEPNVTYIHDTLPTPSCRPPRPPHSAYSARLAQRQVEQIEMEEMLWAQLPVSAPPYLRLEGQRHALRRSSSSGGTSPSGAWEIELQEARGRRSGSDWQRSTSNSSYPFDIRPAAPSTSPSPGFLGAPRSTALPFDASAPTHPGLTSAFSTDTRVYRLHHEVDSSLSPDSRPASFASSFHAGVPNIFLRRPSVPYQKGSTAPERCSTAPPSIATSHAFPQPPIRPLLATTDSSSSHAGSSWQGSSLDAHAAGRAESMSFSHVLAKGIEAMEVRPLAFGAVEPSSRESGGLEEYEGEGEFPWSGSGSGSEGSGGAGRRREEPLSASDWRLLEELAAEEDSPEGCQARRGLRTGGGGGGGGGGGVTVGSGSSKRFRRKVVVVSPSSSIQGQPPPSPQHSRSGRNGPLDPSDSSSFSRSSIEDHHSSREHLDLHLSLPRRSAELGGHSAPSLTSSRLSHPHRPHSPGTQPLKLLRRQERRSSIATGFSPSPGSSPSPSEGRITLPRQRGWRTSLNKLANAELSGEELEEALQRSPSL